MVPGNLEGYIGEPPGDIYAYLGEALSPRGPSELPREPVSPRGLRALPRETPDARET